MSPIPSTNAALALPPDGADLDEVDDAETENAPTGSLTIENTGFSTVNESVTNFHGDAHGVSLSGDDGDGTVNLYGEFSGTIDGGLGDDGVVAHAGSVVRDAEIRGGDGDDAVIQKAGSTFVDTELYGGDGADLFVMSGHNEGTTRIDLGNNGEELDRIRLMPSVTGDILALDPDHSEYEVKDEELSDHDAVELVDDASAGLTWTEQEDGSFGLRNADGEIVSEFTAGGNRKSIENIASYDIDGGGDVVEQFREIEPEMRYSSTWAKWTGDILVVAGSVIPGAQFLVPIGLGFKAAYAADNGQLTWENGLDIGLSAIPGGTALTYVKSGIKTGYSIANQDWDGALTNLSGLIPAGDLKNIVYGAGQTWGGIEAIGDGEYGRAATSFGNTVAVSGVDTSGRIEIGFDATAHVFGGIDALENGQYLAAGKRFYSAGDSAAVIFDDGAEEENIETRLPEGYARLPDGYAPDGADLRPYPDGALLGGNASGQPDLQFEYPTEARASL